VDTRRLVEPRTQSVEGRTHRLVVRLDTCWRGHTQAGGRSGWGGGRGGCGSDTPSGWSSEYTAIRNVKTPLLRMSWHGQEMPGHRLEMTGYRLEISGHWPAHPLNRSGQQLVKVVQF
jgi:hypothetical protein